MAVIPRFSPTERAALLATAETLEDPSKVVLEPLNTAEDAQGRPATELDSQACRWCVFGAVRLALGSYSGTNPVCRVRYGDQSVGMAFTMGRITASEAALAIRAALEEEG